MIEDIINFSTSRNVAALMIEPILGVGGIVVPPEDYLQEVKKVLDKHSILLVLDEVQTGLGRTGKFWAADTFMVQPDVMTLAKALGNGWPIAAVVASDPIENSFEAGDHFSTWGASPVMCAAALATIDFIIEHRLWKNAAKMGNLMMARLKELEDAYNVIGEARGKGLMIGLEIVKDPISKVPGVEECKAIRSICANSGLIIGAGGFWSNVIRIQPPLTIGKENVEEGLNILEDAIRGVEKQAK
jgi:4-aminobutyrate aminotransferase-like enzyme